MALPPLKRLVRPHPKAAFMAAGALCDLCPLVKHRAVRTQWHGEGAPPLALVGEAPGMREIRLGAPFVGPSGKVLNYALGQAGVPRNRLAVLNAIACGPIPSESDSIKKRAADCCRPRLLRELRALRPKGIVAVGAYALRSLAPEGSSGITALRGALLDLADDVADECVTTVNLTRAVEAMTPVTIARVDVLAKSENTARAEVPMQPEIPSRADGPTIPEVAARAVEPVLSVPGTRAVYETSPKFDMRAENVAPPKLAVRAEVLATTVIVPRAEERPNPGIEPRADIHVQPAIPTRADVRVLPSVPARAESQSSPVSTMRAVTSSLPKLPPRAVVLASPVMYMRAEVPAQSNLDARADVAAKSDLHARADVLMPPVDATRAVVTAQSVFETRADGRATPASATRADSTAPPVDVARAGIWASPDDGTRADAKTQPASQTRVAVQATSEHQARLPWHPAFFSTFHPAHIMRGGDGNQDGPEGEGGSAVDLLYFFFLFDLAKAWRFVNGEALAWQLDADLFVDHGGKLHRVDVFEDGPVGARQRPAIGREATESELYDALKRVYDEALVHGSIACDVETDNKDSLEANLTSIAYATPDGAVAATWAAWQMYPRVRALLYEIHQDKRLWWDWQNGIYDRVVFRRHKIDVGGVKRSLGFDHGRHHDTLLQHHAAFPGLPHKLDQMATQFYIVPPWKNEFRTSTKALAELVTYNAGDAQITAKLRVAIPRHVELAKTGRVYEADRQLNVIATRMREYGCFVDTVEQARHRRVQTERLEYMRKRLADEFRAIEKPWREALARLQADVQRKDDPDSFLERVAIRYKEIAERERKPTDIGMFKPKAKKDLVALFNVLNVTVTAYTKTGLPVTDKKAMEAAAARQPLMRRLIHLREAQHLIANYIDLPIKRDGRMHPDWKTNKITGRWGAGRSQNVPNNVAGWPPETDEQGNYKINKDGDFVCPRDNLRSIIVAPSAAQVLEIARRDPALVHPFVLGRARKGRGRMLFGADMDQLELRIVGFLAKDKFLIDIFNQGRDPHAEFARVIFPNAFPQLETEIALAGFKPKDGDGVEALSAKVEAREAIPVPECVVKLLGADPAIVGRTDDIAWAQIRVKLIAKLGDVRKAQKGWKRLRDLAKRIEYGRIYRGEPFNLWEALVKDFPSLEYGHVVEAVKYMDAKLAGVVRWWQQCENYARLNRETRETLLGRVRMYPLGNFNPNVCINYGVQTRGASLIALAFFRFVALTHPELLEFEPLYRMGLLDASWVAQRRDEGYSKWRAPVELILNGHDALTGECDEEDAEKAAKLLGLAMTLEDFDPRDGVRMPYTCAPAVAKRWSKT